MALLPPLCLAGRANLIPLAVKSAIGCFCLVSDAYLMVLPSDTCQTHAVTSAASDLTYVIIEAETNVFVYC